MANKPINLHDQLWNLRRNVNFIQKIYSTNAEEKEYKKLLKSNQPLPDGIYHETDKDNGYEFFFRIVETDLIDNEKNEYLLLSQITDIHAIRKYVQFYFVSTIIGMIILVILLLPMIFR